MHPTQKQVDATDGTRTDALSATPADTLRVAATYLEEHGWTRCRFFDFTNQLEPAACVVGAIRYAVYGYPEDSLRLDGPLGRHVERALWAVADSLGVDVLDDLEPWLDCTADAVQAWNDRPGRTAADVIQALHEAADAYLHGHRIGGDA